MAASLRSALARAGLLEGSGEAAVDELDAGPVDLLSALVEEREVNGPGSLRRVMRKRCDHLVGAVGGRARDQVEAAGAAGAATRRGDLDTRGARVDADEFLELVEDAARRLSPVDPDPADYFTDSQRTALTDVGLDLAPRRPAERDPRARTVALQAVLRDTALTVAGAAERISVDASRIRHRLAAGRLTGWKDRGEWRLPVWQFTNAGVLPGLEAVLEAVPEDQPPLVVAGFMTTPQPDLPISGEPATPRNWLLAGGDPAAVARLVTTLGEPA